MTDTTKILPKLRFPEFANDGEWDVVKLGEVVTFCNSKCNRSELRIDTYISTENIRQDFLGIKRAVNLPQNGSFTKFRIGDILVSNIRPYLKKIWQANFDGAASNDVLVFRTKNQNYDEYVAHLIKSDAFVNYCMEGAKGVKMPRGDKSTMLEYSIPLPSLPEQQKIASLLTSLDEQISAHTKKLEALKAHKKSLMQQLFPANCEKTPKLRFPEFKNAGEWEEVRLGDVANVYQGYGFPDVMQGKKTGKYPFYKVSDISNTVTKGHYKIDVAINYVDDDDLPLLNNAKPIPLGTIIFAKIGEAIRLNRKVITTKDSLIDNNTAGVKANNRKIDDMFLFFIMTMIDLIKFAGGVVPAVKKTIIENIQIIIPEITEQQKIASFLSSIDDMIQAQDDRILKLKIYKKGLMQQMFPHNN